MTESRLLIEEQRLVIEGPPVSTVTAETEVVEQVIGQVASVQTVTTGVTGPQGPPGPLSFTLSGIVKFPQPDSFVVWSAPFDCTVVAAKGYQDTGTGCVIGAFKGSLIAQVPLCNDITVNTADAWVDGVITVPEVLTGDRIYFRVVSVAGVPSELGILVQLTRP